MQTWLCQMCQKEVALAIKGYLVGRPRVFLICRNCWKGSVLPLSGGYPSRVLHGTVSLKNNGVRFLYKTHLTKQEVIDNYVTKLKKED